jgi:hypothetical protein
MSPSEDADNLIAIWCAGHHQLVVSTLVEMSHRPSWSRAVLAQFMLRLMDQDPTSLHVFIEMLEAQC